MLHVTFINASLWPDMPEKLLIMGYSPPCPFLLLTFYQNSYGIFLLPRQYRFAQLLQPLPHLHLTGLFSPLLDLVVFQCCSNYATVTASLFPSSCSPLHWNKSQTTCEFEWFHKTFTSVYWETFVRPVHLLLLSKCSSRTTMFFLNFFTGNN